MERCVDKKFFSLLDLERKGLEKVKQCVQEQNTNGAAKALLSYMRKRTKPVYLDGWENRTIDPNYDTSDADLICKRNILRIDVGDDIDWKMAPIDDPEWSWCLNRHEHFTTLGRAYWYTGNEKYAKEFFVASSARQSKIKYHSRENNPKWYNPAYIAFTPCSHSAYVLK